jgi:hypothetical protein
MPICAACDQLRRQPSDVAPHHALIPRSDSSHLAHVTNGDTGGPQAHYLCRVCGATMMRDAMDDNADPIWDLYAG